MARKVIMEEGNDTEGFEITYDKPRKKFEISVWDSRSTKKTYVLNGVTLREFRKNARMAHGV